MGHRDHFIGGTWITGEGPVMRSIGPANDEVIWKGTEATRDEIDRAVLAARQGAESWSELSFERRCEAMRRFAELVKRHEQVFARLISREMGKPTWESLTEVTAVIAKVEVSIQAVLSRRDTTEEMMGDGRAVTWYRPHGVLAVLGPFNLPAHLPNGHIVPALLAGNTVIFKPSERTPAVGEMMVDLWRESGLPAGVVNLVQGGREVSRELSRHTDVNGVLFTGSYRVGLELSRWHGEHPERMLALEMGGNNPLVVHECRDLDAAAYLTVQSAYLTSGQRCTCARRLIVVEGGEGDAFLDRLVAWIGRLEVGSYDHEPEPFLGPVVSREAAEQLMRAQSDLIARGGVPLVAMRRFASCAALLSPGLLDVTAVAERSDEEHFGPLLQLIRVPDWESAIAEANRTAYGLAAGLICDDANRFRDFRRRVRAGIVNWNRQTTGASGKLPFGGIGLSGNHRPSGFHAVDYCSDPVASLELDRARVADPLPVGIRR